MCNRKYAKTCFRSIILIAGLQLFSVIRQLHIATRVVHFWRNSMHRLELLVSQFQLRKAGVWFILYDWCRWCSWYMVYTDPVEMSY